MLSHQQIMKKTLIILAILFFAAIFVGSVNAQSVNNSNKIETVQKQDYDQNIQIIKKPQPRFSRDCEQFSGRTRILVTFDKSEKVTNVEIVSTSGCFGFDQNALRAAKSIKFKAAMKNGEPVTVKKQVEYSYMIGGRGF